MKIKQYQQLQLLNSGSTNYEEDICKILNIDLSTPVDVVRREIKKALEVQAIEFNKKIKIGKRVFIADEDLLECTYEQFVELDRILAEGDNISNLHRLIAIYLRPRVFSFKKLKYIPKRFNFKDNETIATYIQNNMDIEVANGVILFFYQNASKSLKYINISFLNQMKMMANN